MHSAAYVPSSKLKLSAHKPLEKQICADSGRGLRYLREGERNENGRENSRRMEKISSGTKACCCVRLSLSAPFAGKEIAMVRRSGL